MPRTSLAAASLVIALCGAAMAQSATPGTPPAGPAETAPRAGQARSAASSLSPNEMTTQTLIGMAVYAPKPEGTARDGAPATTGSTVPSASGTPPALMSEAEWRALRERHDNIGQVNALVLTTDGRIRQAVLGVGGFLGIGEKAVALDWPDLRLMRDSNGKLFAVVLRTKDQLNAMPTFVGEPL
jgi:PRC-barrel domain